MCCPFNVEGREETSNFFRICGAIDHAKRFISLRNNIFPYFKVLEWVFRGVENIRMLSCMHKEEIIQFFWISTLFWRNWLVLVKIYIYLKFFKIKKKSEALFMNHVTSYSTSESNVTWAGFQSKVFFYLWVLAKSPIGID